MKKDEIIIKDIFAISERQGESERNRWTKIGIGFVNRDQSINVILDAFPVSGRLHIQDRKPKEGRGS